MKRIKSKIDTCDIPIVFSDGSAIYDKLAKKYIKHKTGYFILAPSGTGKTYYINRQKTSDWIDGDLLWAVTGADYSHDEWGDTFDDILEINARSDVITHQAKKQGFWVLGSSNIYLQPDAIVVPNWEKHISYIQSRERNNYDGGATSDDIDGVKSHIAWIEEMWLGTVPFFDSIDKATDYIHKKYDTKNEKKSK